MRIDQTATFMAPRSLKEQFDRLVHFEEALSSLARLHWAKWDTRRNRAGSEREFKILSELR